MISELQDGEPEVIGYFNGGSPHSRGSQSSDSPPIVKGSIRFKRFERRNVFIYDASGRVAFGLYQIGWYKISSIYRWIRLVRVEDLDFRLRHGLSEENSGQLLDIGDDEEIAHGNYSIVDTGECLPRKYQRQHMS